MSGSITCPRCRNEFEITEVMRSQLSDQIRSEFDVVAAQRAAELDAVRAELQKQRAQLDAAKSEVEERVRQRIDAARHEIVAESRKRLEEEFAVELRDQTAQVKELRDKLQAAHEAELDVRRRERELETRSEGIQLELERRLQAEREKLRTELNVELRRQMADEISVELRDRDDQLNELRAKLKSANETELEMRKRERDLQAKTEELQLEVARQLDAERERIRAEARQQSDHEHELKEAETEKLIGDLQRQIGDLKRKAEQGSQQLQGEVQELALEELLRTAFPRDTIDSVPKGVGGGDCLHRVLDPMGLVSGTILWESKRTKNWSAGWLTKLRDDQRAARAPFAVIVSEALPEGVRTFALIDGVWVCSWACVRELAIVLRVGLIEVAKSRLAVQGQRDKMEMVYNYLASQEFGNRVAGIVEAFTGMRKDLESERNSMHRIWSKRQKQLDRALTNTAGMYGDLQGIIGASLPLVEGLELRCLEGPKKVSQPVSLDTEI
jgi:hypothetical protein